MSDVSLIRTTESRFDNLPGYPFAPHYITVNEARMHYVDEGSGQPILCLHGEPSWSYLYRKMIPILSPLGRVLAPDLIGFGKSDKYSEQEAYSFQMHRDALVQFIEMLDLNDVTLVVHDWGGLLGLRIATEFSYRFARLVILNTFLPAGDSRPRPLFRAWQLFARYSPIFPVGRLVQIACVQPVPQAVRKAYDAPFPNQAYMAGARIFPSLMPLSSGMPGVAAMIHARKVLRQWLKPALVMFSDKDPFLSGADKFFRRLIPAAREQPEVTIHDAGHFLQEDKGEEIAEHIVAFLERTGG